MGGGSDEVKETAQEREAANVAWEQWNDYQDRYVPFENRFIYDVTGMKDGKADAGVWDQRRGDLRGDVNADIMQQATAIPVNPNSGRMKLGTAPTLGKALAKGAIAADAAVDGQRIAGMQAVVDMGRGQANQADLGMQGLARDAADDAIQQSAIDMREKKFYGDTVGSAMGVVADRYNNTPTQAAHTRRPPASMGPSDNTTGLD